MSDTAAPPRPRAATPLERAAAGLDACVHCGFCLNACPTYLALEDENDSPRGRLVLMRAMLDGDILPTDAEASKHIDRCLGCRGCETACPSGVPYGHLLEATRATMAQSRPLPWTARFILYVFAKKPLLRAALAGARFFRWTRIPDLLARIPGKAMFPYAMRRRRVGRTSLAHRFPPRRRLLPSGERLRSSPAA
jgi:glycolate oxidase iron-sulfur subunit